MEDRDTPQPDTKEDSSSPDETSNSQNGPESHPEPPAPETTELQAGNVRPLFGEGSAAPTPRGSKTAKSSDVDPDARIIRRIIAEDPNYNLATVAPLTDLCLKQCIENFEFNSSVITHLDDRQRRRLLDAIAPDLPLKVTSHVIGEDPYWARACHERWPVVDLSRHGGSWKRAFFERMLEDAIETFVPGHTYAPRLEECVSYAAPYVHHLDIRQLLPPLREQPKDKDEGSEGESDSEQSSEPQAVDHLDLGPVLSKLNELEKLALCFTVKKCGMNFDWSVFQFTGRDCLNLSRAIQQHPRLRELHLTRSRVDSERCRVLVNYILKHPTLETLDLSHNFIGDRGARALGKLIAEEGKIRILNLADNRLQATGGLAIAHGLAKKTCQLIRLNLRLNRLRDDGGIAIAKSLLRNESLRELNLAANDLNESVANYFAHVIAHNSTLTHIDMSNNQIGPAGSKKLQDGMERNNTLLHFDLRFTGSSQEAEYSICQKVESNQDRLRQIQAEMKRTNSEEILASGDQNNLPTGITSVANGHSTSSDHPSAPIAV